MKIDLTGIRNWARAIAGRTRIRKAQMQGIIQRNFETIWNTKGVAIGADWKGNDLVKTGELRRSLTGATITTDKNSISITATPPYASYVNAKYLFMELTPETKRDLTMSYMGTYKG